MEKIRDISEVIVAKHRNGPIGNVKLRFDLSTTKFSNFVNNESDRKAIEHAAAEA